MKLRARIPHSRAFVLIACLTLLALTSRPDLVRADLADDVGSAVAQVLNQLRGDEGDNGGFAVSLESLPLTFTFLGFAFCEPPDPTAAPVAEPLPGLNIYECENYATATATVSQDETSATVTVTLGRVFVDVETSREKGILCSLYGDGPPDYFNYPPTGYTGDAVHDGYLLCTVSIPLGIQLEPDGQCYRCSLTPGTLDVTVTPDIFLSEDDCLNYFWNNEIPVIGGTLADLVWPEVESTLRTSAESIVNDAMDQISQALCQLPAGDVSWGAFKSTYGTAAGDGSAP